MGCCVSVGKTAAAPHTLPERYRPPWLSGMIGNGSLLKIVGQHLRANTLPRVVFVHGPSGVGKTTLNSILERALTCTETGEAGEPCGKCASCQAHRAGNQPDVLRVNCGADTGIATMRDALAYARMYPSISRNRVIFLDEVQGLSAAAERALLVCLDHPPANTVFLAGSMSPDEVSKAFRDRCFSVQLKLVAVKELAAHVSKIAAHQKVPVQPPVAVAIAEAAEGVPRAALQLLDIVLTGIRAGVQIDPEKPHEALSKLSAGTPSTMAKNAVLALYANDASTFVRLVSKSDHAVGMIRSMIVHSASGIRFAVAGEAVFENKYAMFTAKDVHEAALKLKLSVTRRAEIGRALEEALKLSASYNVDAASVLVHTCALLASKA